MVKVNSVVADTPRIVARGMAAKSSRKGRTIRILPDSGATMTLVHSRIARRLGIKINQRGGEKYDLFDAQGREMGIDGTCVIYVVPEGCSKPRTLKCLATPSLDEEELLLGLVDMVEWGILKKNF